MKVRVAGEKGLELAGAVGAKVPVADDRVAVVVVGDLRLAGALWGVGVVVLGVGVGRNVARGVHGNKPVDRLAILDNPLGRLLPLPPQHVGLWTPLALFQRRARVVHHRPQQVV